MTGRSFAIGDSADAVRRAGPPPAVIERLTSLGAEIWTWDQGSVRFATSTLRVIAWDDPHHELRAIAMGGGPPTATRSLFVGSSAADVLRLLGQPRAAALDKGTERWAYGRATIVLDAARRAVVGWTDPDRRLPVADLDRTLAEAPRDSLGRPHERAPGDTVAAPHLTLAIALKDTTLAARRADASNIVTFTFRNDGAGTAYTIEPYALITAAGGETANVVWAPTIASLAPGATATREVAVRFPTWLLSNRVVLIGGARELNGFAVNPETRVELSVVSSRAPQLVPVVIEQADQSGDGRVSPRELVDVRVRLANVGAADAVEASASLVLGRDVFAMAGTPPRYQLPRIKPGDSVDVRFTLYTNARAESTSVRLLVRDGRGQSLATINVPLRLTGRPVTEAEAAPLPGSAAGPREGTDVDAPFAERAPLNPDAVAVIFGIDYYRSLPRARFAARDASTMRRYATSVFGIPNDADHILMRMDGDATQAEFRKAFSASGWLARRVTPQSDVVVYFAGHGAAGADRSPLLLPFDGDADYTKETALQLSEVYEALGTLKARRIIVVIDACFSGVSRGGVAIADGARPVVVSIEHPALLRNGMAVFAAAQGSQVANDLPDQQHGLFSYEFFRGLRGAADADRNGAITVEELNAFLAKEVRAGAARHDREQQPLTIARERSLVVSHVPGAGARP
ncbi:MAG: caspase family protein [Gemmatimonadaceae bacterium]